MAMRRAQRGAALILWSFFTVAVVFGLLVSGLDSLHASSRGAATRFRDQGQALDVARAGVVDAYAWFRRQPAQPVGAFTPRRDLTAIPPVNETDDPSVGIVREFEISPGYYGRYEVRAFDDRNGNGRADPGEGVVDVTPNRALTGSGAAWHLESHGFVYRRVDATKPWNVEPNERVAHASVSTEIRRMALVPPATSALCCSRGDRVTVGARGHVDGVGAGGVTFAPSTGTPTVTGDLVGTPTYGSVAGYDASWGAVFGVTPDELKALASVRMPGGGSLPQPFPSDGLVFVEGNVTATAAAPLKGTGILVVQGNLTIATGSNSYFSGLVYVTGNYVQNAPSMVRGTVIVGGTATVQGGTDFAELFHDGGVLGRLLAEVGAYRISRALHRTDVMPGGGIR